MALFQQRARREQARLRLAIDGLAGTGKTYTATLIACILAELMRPKLGRRGRVAVVDTEHESSALFSMTDDQVDEYAALSGEAAIAYLIKHEAFDFIHEPLDNHSPRQYVEMIKSAEANGIDILVIDSLSHAWVGKDGALAQKDLNVIAGNGNNFTAWRGVSEMHSLLVDTMLSCRLHLITTMRRKMEYVINGSKVEKVGLAAIQREGMEYEFSMVGDMDHRHSMTIAKHRTTLGAFELGEVIEKPGEAFARRLWKWLTAGAEMRSDSIRDRYDDEIRRSNERIANRSNGAVEIEAALVAMEADENYKDHLVGLKALADRYPGYGYDKIVRERYVARKNRVTHPDPVTALVAAAQEPTVTAQEEREYIDSLQPEQIAKSRQRTE